ncbi:centromere protein X isoform 3-T3 [Molossus nigricans]|uniref:centromere protein X isoform X2 n=1 Tax=Molossus molossus TaxID=27622 RepID=UPI001745D90A|nr:centromere protein X isoform X2 [Molossus molossus]
MEGVGPCFPKELVSKLLRLHFRDDKTKEAAIRSVRQAQAEDLACVDVDQLEKVLPQLLLNRCVGSQARGRQKRGPVLPLTSKLWVTS